MRGCRLRGTDVVVVVERVRQYGWGVPELPLRRKSRRWGMMGKGNHKGCSYMGWMWWWSSNPFVSRGGRFPNRPYGAIVGWMGDDGWRVWGMDSRPRLYEKLEVTRERVPAGGPSWCKVGDTVCTGFLWPTRLTPLRGEGLRAARGGAGGG